EENKRWVTWLRKNLISFHMSHTWLKKQETYGIIALPPRKDFGNIYAESKSINLILTDKNLLIAILLIFIVKNLNLLSKSMGNITVINITTTKQDRRDSKHLVSTF